MTAEPAQADPAGGRAWDDLTVQSLGVAVEVLDTIAAAGRPVRLTYIAERLDMPRARVHRYLKTLKQLGLVWQERSGERYGLGWKLFHLGQSAGGQYEIKRIVAEPMQQLSRSVDCSVALSVPANGYAVNLFIDIPATPRAHVVLLEGKRHPPLASAQGRIVLAFADPAVRERVLAEPARRYTEFSEVDPDRVRARLQRIRAELYDVAAGEIGTMVTAFAAPLLDRDDRLHGVIAILARRDETPPSDHPRYVQAVQRCAARVSRDLNAEAYARIGIEP